MTTAIKTDNTDTTIVHVKDRLWAMLRDAEDKMAVLDAAEKVLDIFEVTQGMWVEASYCYKVVEIADCIADKCRDYLGHYQHAMTIKRIEKVQQHAWFVRSHFYTLQQAHQ